MSEFDSHFGILQFRIYYSVYNDTSQFIPGMEENTFKVKF